MSIKIRNIRVQHPMETLDNSYFIDLFNKQGKDIKSLLNSLGKNERKIIKDFSDNTVTLGIKAALKVLKTSGLRGYDIDMIVFSSQFPEYTCPTQALMVHHAIKGKKECLVMDMNVNCVGMVVALDNTARYLLEKKHFRRALIIGSDFMTIHCKKDDEFTYPMFGDCACAMILEKTDDDDDSAVIGSMHYTNSDEYYKVAYPSCGMSSLYNDDIDKEGRKLLWTPFNSDHTLDAKISIETLLNRHNLKMDDIKAFCFTQFGQSILDKCADEFGVDRDKFIYVGNEYGYTGTTSPFLALYEGIKKGQIERGDYVAVWSFGINWTSCATLIKY